MLLAITIKMCPHDKNQLSSGLDLVTEFVLNFPRPLLVFTTRKGPRTLRREKGSILTV